ncbi:MAG: RIP metalloprotease RseP [Puniceicoccales bacterium]|nr:RIP metalloprotease RseP [Puniceicoccales bacterium]
MKRFFFDLLPVIYVVLFFGGSIFVHEFGHYLAAKKRGLFVPKFSIGFGPKLFGFKIGGTEFAVSLFPLGGYVSIPQLADFNSVEGSYNVPSNLKTITCLDKIITAVTGPLFNMLFAVILAVAVYFIGIPVAEETLGTNIGYVPPTLALPGGEEVLSPAYRASMLPNDRILAVDGHRVKKFSEILEFIALGNGKDERGHPLSLLEIERDGRKLQLEVNPVIISPHDSDEAKISDDKIRMIGVWPKQNLVIENLHSGTTARDSGLRRGDSVISANGTPIFNWKALHDIAKCGGIVALEVERDGERKIFQVPVTKLAILKPYLGIVLADGTPIDVVPEDHASAFNERRTQFAGLKIFCSGKNFLKANGIENGDLITSVNNEETKSLRRFEKITLESPELSMKILTESGEKTVNFGAISDAQFYGTASDSLLGVIGKYNIVTDHPNPLSQIADVTALTFKTLSSLFSASSNISAEHLMGPAGMIKVLYSSAKTSFPWLLWLVVLVNINLAILNLLPFPVLDGGLIAIAVLEKITGWKCLDRVLSKIQILCFALLMGLIAYVTFFDIRRILAESRQAFELQRQSRLLIHYDD